jgi:replicative DNA helicase
MGWIDHHRYLQLMTGDMRSENRVQEISYISRGLKALARS